MPAAPLRISETHVLCTRIHGGRVNTKVAWFQHWIDQEEEEEQGGAVMQQDLSGDSTTPQM